MLFLNEIIGDGDPISKFNHGLEESMSFLKMVFFLGMVVGAKVLSPGVFKWIMNRSFGLADDKKFGQEEPESYLLSISLLLIFSISSLGLFLTDMGANAQGGSPVLINSLLVLFFVAFMMIQSSLFQQWLFGGKNILNPHFLDLVNFLLFTGACAFIVVLSTWFLSDELASMVRAASMLVVLAVFALRILRLTLQSRSIFHQSAVLIFFYLCAAEIAPFLIVGKLLTNIV